MFNLKRDLFLVALLIAFVASPTSSVNNLFSPDLENKVYLPAGMNDLCSPYHNNDEDCYADDFDEVKTTIAQNVEYRGTVSWPEDKNDFFKIHMVAGRAYTITAANLNGAGDIDLFVYSKPIYDSPDTGSARKGTGTEKVVFTPKTTQEHFILVYQIDRVNITQFLLKVETDASTATPTPIPTSTLTATPIPTATSTPTQTPIPAATSTPGATSTPAATPTPVATSTPADTPTATAIPSDGNDSITGTKVVSMTIGTAYFESVDTFNDSKDYFLTYLVITTTREYTFTLSNQAADKPLKANIKIYRSTDPNSSLKDSVTDPNGDKKTISLKKADFDDIPLVSGLYYVLVEADPNSGKTNYKIIINTSP